MGSIWTQPSPSEVDRAAQRIANGEAISEACKAEGFTLTQLRQSDRQAWADLKAFWHDVQGVEDRTTARDTFREIAANTDAEDRDRIAAGVQLAKASGYLSERVELEHSGAVRFVVESAFPDTVDGTAREEDDDGDAPALRALPG